MTGRKVYHVIPAAEGNWKVVEARAIRATSIHERKLDAINRARQLAKKGRMGQVIIHRTDGEVQKEYTYGKDPVRSLG